MKASLANLLRDLLSGGNASAKARDALLIPIDNGTTLSNTKRTVDKQFEKLGKGIAELADDASVKASASKRRGGGGNGSAIGTLIGAGLAGGVLAYQNRDAIGAALKKTADAAVTWVGNAASAGMQRAMGWMRSTSANIATMTRSGIAVVYGGAARGMSALTGMYDRASDALVKAWSGLKPSISVSASIKALTEKAAQISMTLRHKVSTAVIRFWQKAKGIVRDWLWSLFEGVIISGNSSPSAKEEGGVNGATPAAQSGGATPSAADPMRGSPNSAVTPKSSGGSTPPAQTPSQTTRANIPRPEFDRPGAPRNYVHNRGRNKQQPSSAPQQQSPMPQQSSAGVSGGGAGGGATPTPSTPSSTPGSGGSTSQSPGTSTPPQAPPRGPAPSQPQQGSVPAGSVSSGSASSGASSSQTPAQAAQPGSAPAPSSAAVSGSSGTEVDGSVSFAPDSIQKPAAAHSEKSKADVPTPPHRPESFVSDTPEATGAARATAAPDVMAPIGKPTDMPEEPAIPSPQIPLAAKKESKAESNSLWQTVSHYVSKMSPVSSAQASEVVRRDTPAVALAGTGRVLSTTSTPKTSGTPTTGMASRVAGSNAQSASDGSPYIPNKQGVLEDRIYPVGEAPTNNYGGKQQPVQYRPIYLTPQLGITAEQYHAYREGVASIESAYYGQMGGSSNRFHGRYQMGAGELKDTARALGENMPTKSQYLSDPGMQERYFDMYSRMRHDQLMMRSPEYRGLSSEQKLAVLGYSHNQGAGGASKWLRTGVAGKDAFGTSGTRYAKEIDNRLSALRQSRDETMAQRVQKEFGGTAQAAGNSASAPIMAGGKNNREAIRLQDAPGNTGMRGEGHMRFSPENMPLHSNATAREDSSSSGPRSTGEQRSDSTSKRGNLTGSVSYAPSREESVEPAGRPVSASDGKDANVSDKETTRDVTVNNTDQDGEPRSGRRSYHHVNNDAGIIVVTGERYA